LDRYIVSLFDCILSLSPTDAVLVVLLVHQAEGAFMMGIGFFLRESVEHCPKTGALKTVGTWTYKPPLARDIPTRLNVSLLGESRFDKGILSSKASGEPPLVFATSVALVTLQHPQCATVLGVDNECKCYVIGCSSMYYVSAP
jgi:xanthine dehydrogenase molybdopterin-binding subunit B